MVADLYPRLGFTAADAAGVWWELELDAHRPHATCILVEDREG
jgi:hypothetical protein